MGPRGPAQLLELNNPYNCTGNNCPSAAYIDTSGNLNDYMNSIGFVSTGDWIVTTANTGKNKDTGSEAICFMDTSSPRDNALQPWCDGISGEVQGTDNLLKDDSLDDEVKFKQKEYTEDLASNPAFYTADCQNPPPNLGNPWITEPGWLVDAQINGDQAIFWQYHWPVLDVTELNCSVRSQGHTNPGGEYTMCGSDLQAYIDSIMPPPATGQIALAASADTTLQRGLPDTNDGANLELGPGGGQEIVLRFSEDRIRQLLGDGELVAATLRLSQVSRHGRARRAIRPLTDPFVEGNGNRADADRGTGTGATWNCAEDADISDHVEECLQHWSRSTFDPRPGGRWNDGAQKRLAARRAHHDWRTGQVSWDVSEDVRSGIHAWLIRTPHRKSRRHSAYHSREGAAELPDPVRAPTLLLER